jgi:hypothetical protein
LTASPEAFRVVAGAVVVVELGAGVGPVPLVLGVEVLVVAFEVDGELRVPDTSGNDPRVRCEGAVWKLKTATSPATVATMTMVARFTWRHPGSS